MEHDSKIIQQLKGENARLKSENSRLKASLKHNGSHTGSESEHAVNDVLEALFKSTIDLYNQSEQLSTPGVIQTGLDKAEMITGSQVGFFHYVNTQKQTIQLTQWSTNTKRHCQSTLNTEPYPISHTGIWEKSIKKGQVIVHNHFKKNKNNKTLPKGHVTIQRELIVPIIDKGKVVAILGVGNKPTLYTNFDIKLLNLFGKSLWGVIQRNNTEVELKRREEDLQTISERLALALKSANIGVWDWDVKNNILTWDNQMYHLYGINKNQFSGAYDAWQKGLHPDDKKSGDEQIQKALKGENEFNTEFRVLWPDATVHYIRATAIIRRDQQGEPLQMIGMNYDITNEKTALQALQESEARLRVIFEHSQLGIALGDRTGNVTSANPAFSRMVEYPLHELIGMNFAAFTHPDDAEHEIQLLRKVASGEITHYTIEKRYITKNKNVIWVSINVSAVHNNQNEIINYIGIIENINLRKEQEERLNKTMTDLAESNKQLEQFAYVASHDLQEPLRKVKSFTELMNNRITEKCYDEKVQKYMFFITDGASRMQKLITDLLSYSRITTKAKPFVKLELSNVAHLASENLDLLKNEKNAVIKINKLFSYMIDETQFAQLFQNLFSNAIKFNDKVKPEIKVSAHKENNYYIISVADNGIGIDSKYSNRIFEVFQRLHTHDEYEGTGIGLALCKKIVERHNGSLTFTSEIGRGTTFFIKLPIN